MSTAPILFLPYEIALDLLDHARRELPNEACGLLSGDATSGHADRYHPARNADGSPLRYDLHPEDLVAIMLGIEAAGRDLVAIFHSHTRTPPIPSPTDVRAARYPEALHLLASLTEPDSAPAAALRAWRIVDGHADEAVLRIG